MTYGWEVLDLHGDFVDDLSGVSKRSVTIRLAEAATFEFAGTGAALAEAWPLQRDVLLTWQAREADTPRGLVRGRFVGGGREIEVGRHDRTIGAVDYRGLLNTRRALAPLSWPGVDIAEAGWSLIDYTQRIAPYPGGPMGIGRGEVVPIMTADVEVASGREIDLAIDDQATRYPGFDWWIDVDLQYQARPHRVSHRDFALELGTTVSKVSELTDTAAYGNLVHQTGADGLTPAVRYAPDLGTDARPEGRIERGFGNPDLRTQAGVNGAAETNLSRAGVLAPTRTFTMAQGEWTPDDLWVGDYCPVRHSTDDGLVDVDTIERVVGITINDPPDGTPAVSIEVSNNLAQNVAAITRATPALLAQALRRS